MGTTASEVVLLLNEFLVVLWAEWSLAYNVHSPGLGITTMVIVYYKKVRYFTGNCEMAVFRMESSEWQCKKDDTETESNSSLAFKHKCPGKPVRDECV